MHHVLSAIHRPMRAGALRAGVIGGIVGGVAAVAMDSDHIIDALARTTHPWVVLGCAAVLVLSMGNLIALHRRLDHQRGLEVRA